MTNLKEQIIARSGADERIRIAEHIDNQNNAIIQRKAKQAYSEHIVWLLKELENNQ